MTAKPTVGQRVFLGSPFRQGELSEGVVKVIGRKYFSVLPDGIPSTEHEWAYYLEFELSDWSGSERSDLKYSLRAFETRDEHAALMAQVQEENEVRSIKGSLPDIRYKQLTLDQLRRIKAILEEPAP